MAQQCGPTVDPSTTTTVIRVESGGNPYAININRAGIKIKRTTNPDDAARLASKLVRLGYNIDMGLMQINSRWLSSRITPRDLFDPCTNIRIGTEILSNNYRAVLPNSAGPHDALFRALSVYNTGKQHAGFYNGYIRRILTAAGMTSPLPALPEQPAIKEAKKPQQLRRMAPRNEDKALFAIDERAQSLFLISSP